jgi:hypothetical protein
VPGIADNTPGPRRRGPLGPSFRSPDNCTFIPGFASGLRDYRESWFSADLRLLFGQSSHTVLQRNHSKRRRRDFGATAYNHLDDAPRGSTILFNYFNDIKWRFRVSRFATAHIAPFPQVTPAPQKHEPASRYFLPRGDLVSLLTRRLDSHG